MTQTTTDSSTKDNETNTEPPPKPSEAAVDFLERIGEYSRPQFPLHLQCKFKDKMMGNTRFNCVQTCVDEQELPLVKCAGNSSLMLEYVQ